MCAYVCAQYTELLKRDYKPYEIIDALLLFKKEKGKGKKIVFSMYDVIIMCFLIFSHAWTHALIPKILKYI